MDSEFKEKVTAACTEIEKTLLRQKLETAFRLGLRRGIFESVRLDLAYVLDLGNPPLSEAQAIEKLMKGEA
jgi:hypothetical protein